jgi:hypothetical protein
MICKCSANPITNPDPFTVTLHRVTFCKTNVKILQVELGADQSYERSITNPTGTERAIIRHTKLLS